jgi:hypothetical protein
MNFFQTVLQAVEVGKGQIVARIIPLLTVVVLIIGVYDALIYCGLNDAQSMDNAQLGRQIFRHQGFTTQFLRPAAIGQLRDYRATLKDSAQQNLFPPDQFPRGTPKIIPDTYNAPGFPCLLAAYFYLIHPDFNQGLNDFSKSHMFAGDQWIPLLNQFFVLLTAFLVFALGRRLFDDRVAWVALVGFLATDLVWKYSITGLSTTFLMFLVTAALMCALEIFCVGEDCALDEDRSFLPAFFWAIAGGLLLCAACLTRLHLLILLLPMFVFLQIMPKRNFLLFFLIALVVLGAAIPWFVYMDTVSGNPLGSNAAYLLYGAGAYMGNQIFCAVNIPSYELIARAASQKEYTGLLWHFVHGWNMLGSNPFILLFGAAVIHQFRRHRTRWFYWLLWLSALTIILVNNLGSAKPADVDPWNTLVVLFPCMLVMGCAFFFVLLDRLHIEIRLLTNIIVIGLLLLCAFPLTISLINGKTALYNYPPYIPPVVRFYGQIAQPDEWVTSDMPWAAAWYADRPSLWLPDSIADFEKLNSSVCPTGILMLTPVSWEAPLSNFTTGEYRDWSFAVTKQPVPTEFPLFDSTELKSLSYIFYSDRARWPGQ